MARCNYVLRITTPGGHWEPKDRYPEAVYRSKGEKHPTKAAATARAISLLGKGKPGDWALIEPLRCSDTHFPIRCEALPE